MFLFTGLSNQILGNHEASPRSPDLVTSTFAFDEQEISADQAERHATTQEDHNASVEAFNKALDDIQSFFVNKLDQLRATKNSSKKYEDYWDLLQSLQRNIRDNIAPEASPEAVFLEEKIYFRTLGHLDAWEISDKTDAVIQNDLLKQTSLVLKAPDVLKKSLNYNAIIEALDKAITSTRDEFESFLYHPIPECLDENKRRTGYRHYVVDHLTRALDKTLGDKGVEPFELPQDIGDLFGELDNVRLNLDGRKLYFDYGIRRCVAQIEAKLAQLPAESNSYQADPLLDEVFYEQALTYLVNGFIATLPKEQRSTYLVNDLSKRGTYSDSPDGEGQYYFFIDQWYPRAYVQED